MVPHEVIKTGNDHTIEVFFNGVGSKNSLGSHEAVYEKNGLKNLDVENPEGPETD
jgi:hypothetical protein